MGFVEQIESAPKNGNVIILQNAALQALGRWDQKDNRWVHPDGTAVQFSPTHWRASHDSFLPSDETEEGQKQPFTRLILVLALVTAGCVTGSFFWIGWDDAVSLSPAAFVEGRFSRETVAAVREPRDVVPTVMLENQQTGNSSQRELKAALDKSEARSETLARELNEAKQLAHARQMELKAALDESEKTVVALARELHDTIASAEKSSSASITTQDGASSHRSLNLATEQLDAASGITALVPPTQSTGLQTPSDAVRDDGAADTSGQLSESNRSQPDRPETLRAITPAEEAKLIARAESLIKDLDFASARLLLAHALQKGSARAAFMMAESYDGQMLRSWQAYGMRGDAEKALEFYQIAAAAGIDKARERLEALQLDARFEREGGVDRSR